VPGRIPAVAVLLESCRLIAAAEPVGVLTELLLEELELLTLLLEELLLEALELLELLLEELLLEALELLELLLEELLAEELELLELLLEELLADELELLALLLEELLPLLEVVEPTVVLAPPPQALRIDTVARTASSCFVMGMILHTVRRAVFRN
jgi:hypothetical protein